MNALINWVGNYWDETVSSMACLITALSCFLLLNHAPRQGCWVDKAMSYLIGAPAFGIAVGPLFEIQLQPSLYEMGYRCSIAVYSVWLTRGYWRELVPGLDRRAECGPAPAQERRETA